MDIINIKRTLLKPYENNPRHNDDAVEAVARSIEEFGFLVPCVVTDDNVLVTGHTRLKAAQLLGLEQIPCIRAENLSDEQIKAFRLADNKVSEIATWDMELLGDELAEIFDIDMESFGFDVSDIDIGIGIEPESGGYYGDERERTFRSTNFDYYDELRVEGAYDMPVLQPVDHVPTRLIGFNYARTSTEYDAGLHFYLDDYQFERIWNQPDLYIPLLQKFDCCLTPNFSIYLDMPKALKIWNTYRARLLGQIMQDNGIITIPIVYWSDESSWDFCFDGIPANSTISVNNIGNSVAEAKAIWDRGMRELIRRKEPQRILMYGNGVRENFDFGDIEIIYYENDVTKRMQGHEEK